MNDESRIGDRISAGIRCERKDRSGIAKNAHGILRLAPLNFTTTEKRFRSWYINTEIVYRRTTDEIAKHVVVRFDQRPADDVVGRLKAAGFRYRSTTAWKKRKCRHGKIAARRD